MHFLQSTFVLIIRLSFSFSSIQGVYDAYERCWLVILLPAFSSQMDVDSPVITRRLNTVTILRAYSYRFCVYLRKSNYPQNTYKCQERLSAFSTRCIFGLKVLQLDGKHPLIDHQQYTSALNRGRDTRICPGSTHIVKNCVDIIHAQILANSL